jgi:hypothetical protein
VLLAEAGALETINKMKQTFAAILLLVAGALTSSADAGSPKLTGSWEAARTPDDERLYLVLKDMGKAEIIGEYDFTLPGQPGKRRGRSTTFAHWTLDGDQIIVTYSRFTDRLRYVEQEALSVIGLSGSAPALKPVGKRDPKSKLGTAVLWKAPHDYRVKAPDSAAPDAGASAAAGAAAPAK